MKKLMDYPEWKALQKHHQTIASCHMRDLFAQDPDRFQRFSINAAGLLLDFSKNRIQTSTIDLLCKLAESVGLSQKINDLFNGKFVNTSEKRPALHPVLRDPHIQSLLVGGQNIVPEIKFSFEKMVRFCEQIANNSYLGFTQKPITEIVNIGIGGSDLGPLMVTEALTTYQNPKLHYHFVSNVDGAHLNTLLKALDPAATLFIISSKSFTTLETLTNAHMARQWLQQALGADEAFQKHFIAVTANIEKALHYGFTLEQIFPFGEWVGGRYSIWSTIGLPIALAIGIEHFKDFLAGAYAMDEHFRSSTFSMNMPVIMALLEIWYSNFFAAETQAIIPYCHYLKQLPAYIQQLAMESNGKMTDHSGALVEYTTAPVLWGGYGCNSQHAFHQMLHQGTRFIPVDFIVPIKNDSAPLSHHSLLFVSCLSQSHALMQGKTHEEILAELLAQGMALPEALRLIPHKMIPGNRPSNTLLLDQLDPYSLGALLALYEHKIYVQSAIWHINPFDQWGVEFGKELAQKIYSHLQTPETKLPYDNSTNFLIQYYRQSLARSK